MRATGVIDHPPVVSNNFANATEFPPEGKNKARQRVYNLKDSIDLINGDETIVIYRNKIMGLLATRGKSQDLNLEDLLSGQIIAFLRERVFCHTIIESAEVKRRSISVMSTVPESKWRLIDRHILEGIELLNRRSSLTL